MTVKVYIMYFWFSDKDGKDFGLGYREETDQSNERVYRAYAIVVLTKQSSHIINMSNVFRLHVMIENWIIINTFWP